MKIVACVVVFAVLWAWSSSGPVPCNDPDCGPFQDDPDNSDPCSAHLHRSQRGVITTVNKTARYVGKKLHIIRKRDDKSVSAFQQEKSMADEGSVAKSSQSDLENGLRQIRTVDSVTDVHPTKRDILDSEIKQTPSSTNSSAPKENRSKRSTENTSDNTTPSEKDTPFASSNTQNETGAERHSGLSNRTKRSNDSGDPRYILVHDVPPCKKRRSIGDYDQPAPVCNTQGGKNITIIIQNSMETSEQPRHARAVEEDGKNGSEAVRTFTQHQVLDKREAIGNGDDPGTKARGNSTEAKHQEHRLKGAEAEQMKNASKRAIVDDPSAALENQQKNPVANTSTGGSLGAKDPSGHIMKIQKADAKKNEKTGENVAIGRKLLWTDSDDDDQNYPFSSDNFRKAERVVIYPTDDEQDFKSVPKQESDGTDEAKTVADFHSDAFLGKLEGIGQVTSVARCVCAVFSELHCIHPVISGRFRDLAEARGCARACLEVAERYCHLSRTVPIKNTNDADHVEERARQLEQAHHLEVAWLIILVLNIVVGINTLVIGYMCSSAVEKKKRGVFLLHDYQNIPHGID